MYIETHSRAIIKAVSYRVFGSLITAFIIYFFVGRVDFAVAGGIADALAKIVAFYFHERAWNKIKIGRKQIEPFNLWFTGLPLSGKTTIADKVYEELKKLHIPLERIDSKDIRDLIPEIGYSREDRNTHMHRIGHLIKTLQNNSISTVASFVSPYKESRKAIREMVKNNIVVYVKADIESCKARDYKGVYARALSGELDNFPGINDVYEEPQKAEIIIDTDTTSVDEAVKIIVKYLKKNYIKV
jgi:adenylylsulfate kinase